MPACKCLTWFCGHGHPSSQAGAWWLHAEVQMVDYCLRLLVILQKTMTDSNLMTVQEILCFNKSHHFLEFAKRFSSTWAVAKSMVA